MMVDGAGIVIRMDAREAARLGIVPSIPMYVWGSLVWATPRYRARTAAILDLYLPPCEHTWRAIDKSFNGRGRHAH